MQGCKGNILSISKLCRTMDFNYSRCLIRDCRVHLTLLPVKAVLSTLNLLQGSRIPRAMEQLEAKALRVCSLSHW